jgi:hypothetical protein
VLRFEGEASKNQKVPKAVIVGKVPGKVIVSKTQRVRKKLYY